MNMFCRYKNIEIASYILSEHIGNHKNKNSKENYRNYKNTWSLNDMFLN
jgi:hypothetical protein